VGLGEVDAGALGRNLGKPYTAIPDPFGERDSYAAHFAALLKADADRLEIPVEMVSNTELYADGAFDDVTRRVLSDLDGVREVLSQYQDKVDGEYVPFNPVCGECGKITETVTSVDLDAETVEYVCTDMDVGDNTIEGCGHEGTATFREGKLPWRLEWPGQWDVLGVDFEPFGKDHAEGSWPSGVDVARNVLGIEPPVPMVYEWFTLNGEPLSPRRPATSSPSRNCSTCSNPRALGTSSRSTRRRHATSTSNDSTSSSTGSTGSSARTSARSTTRI